MLGVVESYSRRIAGKNSLKPTKTVATSVPFAVSMGPGLNAVQVAELTVVTVISVVCVRKTLALGAKLKGKFESTVPN